MWELDYKESLVLKTWCFWTVVLEKTLESLMDCMEIQPVHPESNQFWIFTGRTDAETPILWPADVNKWFIGKDPMLERLKVGREGDDREWDGWMLSPTQWTWVWLNFGSWNWLSDWTELKVPFHLHLTHILTLIFFFHSKVSFQISCCPIYCYFILLLWIWVIISLSLHGKWKLLSCVWLFVTPWNIQARILGWVAFPFFRGSSQPRDQTEVSHIAGRFFTSWATRIMEWVAYPFSSRSSWAKNKTGVSWIAGEFFTSWAFREALLTWKDLLNCLLVHVFFLLDLLFHWSLFFCMCERDTHLHFSQQLSNYFGPFNLKGYLCFKDWWCHLHH